MIPLTAHTLSSFIKSYPRVTWVGCDSGRKKNEIRFNMMSKPNNNELGRCGALLLWGCCASSLRRGRVRAALFFYIFSIK